MKYRSTRSDERVTSTYALLHGLAADGGLYVPETFPENTLVYDDIKGKSYVDTACIVLEKFFTDFNRSDIRKMAEKAYNSTTFDDERIVPLRSLDTDCLLYTSPSPRDTERSRMPSSA